MQYGWILASIEAEIERLTQARDLLASLDLAPTPKALAPKRASKRTSQAAAPAEDSEPMPAVEQAPEMAVKRVAPRTRRTRTSPRAKAPSAAVAGALAAAVPSTPVFYSAEKIRQEQSQKQEEKAEHPADGIAAAPLSAEQLMHRWLQGPNA